ncbi:hypothetical protein B0B36_24270 [Pseudomonas syringae pv. actinidifoliorum]|nr:hypothetical protein B0B36_24270 [Pseudomonas syringae pv. actinidifoliorum]
MSWQRSGSGTNPLLLLPVGRGSELVRDLPGTGSKTVTYGVSGTTRVACFRAASHPFANKFACMVRLEGRRRNLVRF